MRIVPANEASWEDLSAIFGARGMGSRCYCQRYKLARGQAFGNFPVQERAHRLRMQTECGNPGSDTTRGLVAYRALEDYPMVSGNAIAEELHVGTLRTFAAAGFIEVARPGERRAVVRIEFGDDLG